MYGVNVNTANVIILSLKKLRQGYVIEIRCYWIGIILTDIIKCESYSDQLSHQNYWTNLNLKGSDSLEPKKNHFAGCDKQYLLDPFVTPRTPDQ